MHITLGGLKSQEIFGVHSSQFYLRDFGNKLCPAVTRVGVKTGAVEGNVVRYYRCEEPGSIFISNVFETRRMQY